MTGCPSIAYIIVEGREVAMIPCTLERDHDVDEYDMPRTEGDHPFRPATPHAHTLTWSNPEGMLDSWPEYADPDEVFDLEVDIAPDEVLTAAERTAELNE